MTTERDLLEQQKAAASMELARLREQLAKSSQLEAEQQRLKAELEELDGYLGRPKPNTKLPLLGKVHIATPCDVKWSEMFGDDRTRFCDQCSKDVFNFSAMNRAEAEALIVEKEGKLCAQFYQRADGTVLTADCVVGVRRRRRRHAAYAVSMVAAAALGTVLSIGLRKPPPPSADEIAAMQVTMPLDPEAAEPVEQAASIVPQQAIAMPPVEPPYTGYERPERESRVRNAALNNPQPRLQRVRRMGGAISSRH